jgi:hypothetical protein
MRMFAVGLLGIPVCGRALLWRGLKKTPRRMPTLEETRSRCEVRTDAALPPVHLRGPNTALRPTAAMRPSLATPRRCVLAAAGQRQAEPAVRKRDVASWLL